MSLLAHKSEKRSAFTLVELMVVILIIAVLVSLIGSAVWRGITKAKQTQNRSEIAQLAAALEAFKTRFGVGYPPSRIRLCERYAYYDLSTGPTGNPVNQLDFDSVNFLRRMFPRIDMANWAGTLPINGIDWNSNGVIDGTPPAAGVDGPGATTLYGDQCLVFFLGGIPGPTSQPPTCLGFSTNPGNPAAATTDRIAPLFEFQTNRLGVLTSIPATRTAPFYSYADAYGIPYAYFSSGRTRGNYNRYAAFPPPAYSLKIAFGASDCDGMTWALAEAANPPPPSSPTPPRYLNQETFQIISAGADRTFGTGTVVSTALSPAGILLWAGTPTWTKSTAGTQPGYRNQVNPATGQMEPGHDDQSNFSESLLGVSE